MTDDEGRLIIHRDYPGFEGEHETDRDSCWCQPLIVDPDDPRSVDDLVVAARALPN